MKNSYRMWSILAAILLVPLMTWAAPSLNDGWWEITTETVSGNRGSSFLPARFSQCLTQTNPVPHPLQRSGDCNVSGYEVIDNKVVWSVECHESNGNIVRGSGTVTYNGDYMVGEVSSMTNFRTGSAAAATMRLSGKRVGPCR